jgi:adenylate kinase family enzyme
VSEPVGLRTSRVHADRFGGSTSPSMDGVRHDGFVVPSILEPPMMKRVLVVGISGVGKTTFARALASALGTLHIEADKLFWDPGWRCVSREEDERRTQRAIAAGAWIMDVGYPLRVALDAADTLIVLDLPVWLAAMRLVRRTVVNAMVGRESYPGCRSSVRRDLFSLASPLLLVFKYRARRKRYANLLADWRSAQRRIIVLKSPRQVKAFLRRVDA